MTTLTPDHATRFATATLSHLGREYPYKMDLVLNGPDDAKRPREHHPIFHGSFDWHSCVHGWWQVMRLRRLFPDAPFASEIAARADAMLVPDKAAVEQAYLARAVPRGFERPYGWAWLLALHGELALAEDRAWGAVVEPMARAVAAGFHAYLPRLTYAVRTGGHPNTAFALVLAHGWAASHDPALARLIEGCAQGWFGDDNDARPWEPSGEDFLSPVLCEGLLMAVTQPDEAFARWW
ncbi:MAG: DUF2891 family protein, partial [Lysobacteraceae bacterium]